VQYALDNSEGEQNRYELNPDHTHFIVVDDDGMHAKMLEFRIALENRLQKPITLRRQKRNQSVPNGFNQTITKNRPELNEAQLYETIPVVCLLIGGGVGSISLVLTKLMQNIPILVFKGTGNAPDLISCVHEDVADRSLFVNITENSQSKQTTFLILLF
jgi:hypothetical protein